MFNKILIANRGEIAIRIIRTCKKMGIKTVAVYSEADTNALHVSMADEAVFIGPSPAHQSYLVVDNLLDAIARTGAQAVHPGYGFLSENEDFAEAVAQARVTFIGPPSDVIRRMGDKIEAKKLAAKARVTTVPGHTEVIKDDKEATKIAARIGFPVILKAAAGGGGKGMRIVRDKSEMKQAFSSATNEARNSFSDARVFIEKFIERPRHIEIQILGDTHGNIVCLGERECSIQRNHQKVVEESPSPFLDEKTRKKMYEQSIALAKKVGYVSAGTIEFIMDQDKNFYFLEMNTRLQVEHAVTEMVTGYDLVELMIRIAAGEKIPFTQKDIQLNGWSMECRIYAEDPTRGFLPSVGRITEYKEPEIKTGVRLDSSIYAGGEVSMFYDAMIAKLITHGKTRADAVKLMQSGLGSYVVRGISHNINFLEALMTHPRFIEGNLTTNFIKEEYPDGFSGAQLNEQKTKVFVGVGIFVYLKDAYRATTITGQTPGRERKIGTRWVVSVDGQNFPIYVRNRKDGYEVRYENETFAVYSNWILGNKLFQGVVNGQNVNVNVEYVAGGFKLVHSGSSVKVTVTTPRVAELTKFVPKGDFGSDNNALLAPISGRVVTVKVKVGDALTKGQEVVILEAMKMENILYAENDVTVKNILIKESDSVQINDVLLEFEPVPHKNGSNGNGHKESQKEGKTGS